MTDSFVRFTDLPPEIRVMIWRFAIMNSSDNGDDTKRKVHLVTFWTTTFPLAQYYLTNQVGAPWYPPLDPSSAAPSTVAPSLRFAAANAVLSQLARVCFEARAEVKQLVRRQNFPSINRNRSHMHYAGRNLDLDLMFYAPVERDLVVVRPSHVPQHQFHADPMFYVSAERFFALELVPTWIRS
jgi:hypothetical protein